MWRDETCVLGVSTCFIFPQRLRLTFFWKSIYVRGAVRHAWDIYMNIQPGRKMGIKTKQHCRRRSHWPWREFGECLRKPRANAGRETLLAFVRVRGKVSTSSRVTSHVIFMLTAYWLNELTLWLATPNHWSASLIAEGPFPFSPIRCYPCIHVCAKLLKRPRGLVVPTIIYHIQWSEKSEDLGSDMSCNMRSKVLGEICHISGPV